MQAGGDILGTEWERAQLEDHPAPLRTPANPIRTESQMEAAHAPATGPVSAPSPGTMYAHDARYWAHINQFRHTLQDVSEAEMQRDLVRRAAW